MKKTDIFLIFAQNIDCGYTLEPPQGGGSTSTHNLCFGAKIRKKVYENPGRSPRRYANKPMHYAEIFEGGKK